MRHAARFTHSNLQASAHRSDRAGGQHLRRRHVRHACRARPPAGVNRLYEIADNISHQAGAHALRAGVDFLYNDRHDHLPAIDSRQLLVFLAGEFPEGTYNNAGFTQTFGNSRGPANESEHRLVMRRMNGRLARA